MSRIGNKAITIPEGVEITVAEGNEVTVKGPKGTLTKTFSPLMGIEIDNGILTVKRPNEEKHTKQLHGTTRALINAMVEGVHKGFTKQLKIVGIGYRAVRASKKPEPYGGKGIRYADEFVRRKEGKTAASKK